MRLRIARYCIGAALSAALTFTSCAGALSSGEQLHVVNLMPVFLEAWDRGADKPMDERVHLMKVLVFFPNAGAFNTPQFSFDDVRLAYYLEAVAPFMPAIRRLATSLETSFPSLEARFSSAFPDFKPGTRVYFQPSLLNFDAQVRYGVMRFGLDGIAKYDGPNANLGVLVSHELFHIYHTQVQSATAIPGEGPALWQKMWSEGLATYVSSRLNPEATRAQALLSNDLASLPDSDVHKLACLIEGKLDSQSADTSAFFDAGSAPAGLPPRGAYLVGFLIAQKMGQDSTLRSLAYMNGPVLRERIASETHALCGH
jgi:hypothetical protein